MTRAVLSFFNLELSRNQTLEDIKERAANLLPTEFHRDPEAKHEDEGNYQCPIIARGVSSIWFNGTKPTAFRFPDSMDPIPTESVAYVAALVHDILSRVAKDGVLKTETRSGGDSAEQDGVSDRRGSWANIDPVKTLMAVHLRNLRTFEKGDVDAYDAYLDDLRKATLKCVGKSEEEPTRSDQEPVPGMLSAASFAGERKYIASRARPPTNSAPEPPKSRPQPKPRPQPSTTEVTTKVLSKVVHTLEQSDDEDILCDTTPVAVPDKRRIRDKSPEHVDEEMGEPENEKLGGEARTQHSVTPYVNEDAGGHEELDSSLATDKALKKRKPLVAGDGQEEDVGSEHLPKDELQAKKPRLTRQLAVNDSNSDDEGEDGGEHGSERRNNMKIGGKASDDLPSIHNSPNATVPDTSKQSSPLSTPEASPVPSKRETRSSKQGKGGQTLENEPTTRMAVAVERRKAAEEAKRTQVVSKKKNRRAVKEGEDEIEGPVEKQPKKPRKK
ncbi:hypothetical protein RhiLY_00007 [Ceratobasidium sp. AG-Ba]|nr:hypothetical protein RhiLY_00007 [Ceratobasidium sp. AG-Ba]